jgi:hypothetical protein
VEGGLIVGDGSIALIYLAIPSLDSKVLAELDVHMKTLRILNFLFELFHIFVMLRVAVRPL